MCWLGLSCGRVFAEARGGGRRLFRCRRHRMGPRAREQVAKRAARRTSSPIVSQAAAGTMEDAESLSEAVKGELERLAHAFTSPDGVTSEASAPFAEHIEMTARLSCAQPSGTAMSISKSSM